MSEADKAQTKFFESKFSTYTSIHIKRAWEDGYNNSQSDAQAEIEELKIYIDSIPQTGKDAAKEIKELKEQLEIWIGIAEAESKTPKCMLLIQYDKYIKNFKKLKQ